MAVPSSGQLSLFGIAMEKIHAAYAEPLPTPGPYAHVGPLYPVTISDHKQFDSPDAEPFRDIYSPSLMQTAFPAPGDYPQGIQDESAFENNYAELGLSPHPPNLNIIGDISLTAMQTSNQPAQGHTNSTHNSHPGMPVTTLNEETYLGNLPPRGSVGITSAGHDHPTPTVLSSTIMYVMYIGDTGMPALASPPATSTGYSAIAFGFNPSIFEDGRNIALGGPPSAPGPSAGQYWGTQHPDGTGAAPTPKVQPPAYESLSFYHPQGNHINTTSPAPHPFPSTSTGDYSMSNFYGYDHDFVAPLPTGVHVTSTAIFTGNQGTSLQTYNVDFSSPTHLGTTTVGNPATSIYYIVAYKNGAAPGPIQPFVGDIQFTFFQLYGPPSPRQIPFAPPTPGFHFSDLRTSVSNPPSPSPLSINPLTPQTNAQTVVSSYDPKMTTAVSTSTTNGRWFYKSSGAPGSGGTGVTDPTGYLGTETSGPGPARINQWFILYGNTGRTGAQITSNEMQFKFYANGANVGSCFVGLKIG